MMIDEQNNNIFIIEKLNGLKNSMNKDKLNLEEIRRRMDIISNYSNYDMYEYLNAMLDPINKKGVKIPNKIPIPTCSFQLHNSLTFRPNASGMDVFSFNPFFLSNDSLDGKETKDGEFTANFAANSPFGTYFFNGFDTVDGTKPVSNWYFPSTFSQVIPYVYDKYRLVSACCVIKYIGPLEEVKGVIGGAVSYLKTNYLGCRMVGKFNGSIVEEWGARNPDLDKFGDFELIRDSIYFREHSCLEGLKMLYFPLDNSFKEFKKVFDGSKFTFIMDPVEGPCVKIPDDYLATGFQWTCYLMGCPTTAGRNFKLDYYLNYECIPKAEFMNYIPVSISYYHIPDELFQKFVKEVQEKVIQNYINN